MGRNGAIWLVFGSGPGIGCTSVAKLFARRIAAAGLRVLVLGLDLYDPGMSAKLRSV